ncbi:MAG: regulator of protease activity HflC (stomatin/prohibitin superfamily) [Bacillariaceae sp.]|jgi:regulator of protease activity HflC (stomatin/prohibitin superfamily)
MAMKMGRTMKRCIAFCLLVVMLILASSTTITVRADEMNGEDDVVDMDQAADAAAAAEMASARKAAEEAQAEAKRKAEAAASKAKAEADAKKKAEEEAAAIAAEEAAKKTDGAFASLTSKISGATDALVSKSQSLIESAKSMTGKQKKQTVAIVAATGFGAVFLAGGKKNTAAAFVKGGKR